MNDIQKRFLLFIFGCIVVRTIFVVIAKQYTQFLPIMGIGALIPAIGFIYIWLTDSRKTGQEVFGKNIWWNDLRPIHGILYALFAYMAICSDSRAWVILMLDVLIGLSCFLYFHYAENNFKQLY